MIAQEHFILTLENGTEIPVTMTLDESPAFDYGNHTCVIVEIEGEEDKLLDTRYEKEIASPELFHEWSYNWLKETRRSTITITRMLKGA